MPKLRWVPIDTCPISPHQIYLRPSSVRYLARGPDGGMANNFEVILMKADTHPNYEKIAVSCSCGNSFETRSTVGKNLNIDVCSECHPFYTGKQKVVDTAGRVDKFRQKYARK